MALYLNLFWQPELDENEILAFQMTPGLGPCTFVSYNVSESSGQNAVHIPGFGPFEVDVFKGEDIKRCKEKDYVEEINEICIWHRIYDARRQTSEAGWEGIYIHVIFEGNLRLNCDLQQHGSITLGKKCIDTNTCILENNPDVLTTSTPIRASSPVLPCMIPPCPQNVPILPGPFCPTPPCPLSRPNHAGSQPFWWKDFMNH